jgi:hypothetical protein
VPQTKAGEEEQGVPEEIRQAWEEGKWHQPEVDAGREAALPKLRAILARFSEADTGLAAFAKESQDFAIAQPYWGFKGFAQMQVNQYAKIAQAAGIVEEAERVLRAALRAPDDDDAARAAFRDLGQLTSG